MNLQNGGNTNSQIFMSSAAGLDFEKMTQDIHSLRESVLSADPAPVLEKIKEMISAEKSLQPQSDGPVRV